MLSRKTWSKEYTQIALRSLGTYLLCLGIYFFYQRTVAPDRDKALGYTPYLVITLWCLWIFIHNRVLIRRFLFNRLIVAYLLSLVAGIALTAYIQNKILLLMRGVDNPLREAALTITFYTFIGSLVFLAFLYIKERRDFYQTASLKKEVELQQLKNQLNPHFLFNSLNNIYSYNLENNTYGNDLILKLSQLMRFIVESTRQDIIKLSEEIDFIDNYIAFEKERLGYRCDIQYRKNLAAGEKKIPPLLLFPFIENAFKHGADTISESKIEIDIGDTDGELSLMVRNGIAATNGHSSKTGLSNVGRRLELLFPNKHQLQVRQDADSYTVSLKLQL